MQPHGWLVCPAEGWQLNLAAESLQLADVRQKLATAFEVSNEWTGHLLDAPLYRTVELCCSGLFSICQQLLRSRGLPVRDCTPAPRAASMQEIEVCPDPLPLAVNSS